jgi:hypothetical protein
MVLFEKTSHICTHARDDLGASTHHRNNTSWRERERRDPFRGGMKGKSLAPGSSLRHTVSTPTPGRP